MKKNRLFFIAAVISALLSPTAHSSPIAMDGDYVITPGSVPGANGDLTVEGTLEVQEGVEFLGSLDVYGGIQFGSTEGMTPVSAMSLGYDEVSTTYTLTLGATRDSVIFLWQQNLGGTPEPKMELDAANQLTLFDAAGDPAIVLNPATGAITVDGKTMGGGAGVWETSGADVFLDGSGKVGIGTSTLVEKLTIQGNIALVGGNRSIKVPDTVGEGAGYSLAIGAASSDLSSGIEGTHVGGSLSLTSGSSLRGNAGDISISAGEALNNYGDATTFNTGGDVSLLAGDSNNGPGGALLFRAGDSHILNGYDTEDCIGGDVSIFSGDGDMSGGDISLTAGLALDGNGGKILLTAGYGDQLDGGGDIVLESGAGGPNYGYTDGGNIELIAAWGSRDGGDILLTAGPGDAGDGGNIQILAGSTEDYGMGSTKGGSIEIQGGTMTTGDSQGAKIVVPHAVANYWGSERPTLTITGRMEAYVRGGNVAINGGATEDLWEEDATDGDVLLANLRGNVGIGTDAPEAKLDVEGSAVVEDDLAVRGTLRVEARGDLSMGDFDAGPTP